MNLFEFRDDDVFYTSPRSGLRCEMNIHHCPEGWFLSNPYGFNDFIFTDLNVNVKKFLKDTGRKRIGTIEGFPYCDSRTELLALLIDLECIPLNPRSGLIDKLFIFLPIKFLRLKYNIHFLGKPVKHFKFNFKL